ncbi:ABC transporter substrate-binding protein [Streptomyces olivaceoviridis]|uniref:ABC transporter substrate-binding protein n=1 Tax=Streptomyces olivaceoviridis TaxID=1921 RepID=UPI0036F9F731
MGTRNLDRRTILKAAGASAATLGLAATAGCGGDSGSGNGTVTIRYSWWGAEERAKKINQSIRLFEEKYPKIKVKTDFQTYQSFWEKFQTQAAGGNPPDVFQNAVTFLSRYDKRGILLDLTSQAQAGNLSLDHFREGATKVGEVDGKQLGVPVGSNTMALVIDKKVFRKAGVEPRPGWTWDEYFKALKTIHDKTKVPGDTGYFTIMYLYDLYLRQNGKAFFTDDGLGFDESDLTEWWTDGYNRVKAGHVTDPKVVSQDQPKSSLSAGHGASEFTWDNFTVRYSAEGGLGVHQRHRPLRPRRQREPGPARRRDAGLTGIGGAPSHGRRRSRPQSDAGHGPAREYPYSYARTSSRTLDPWTGTTTASAACGPCPPRRPPCTRHWSGPRTIPAGGHRCGR